MSKRPSRSAPPTIRDAEIVAIREAAREAVDSASLRGVALTIGIGHSTLANFLAGARPHPRLRRILYEWYAKLNGAAPLTSSELDRLTSELPEHVRERVRAVLADALCRGYSDAGMKAPRWLVVEAGLDASVLGVAGK